MDKNRNKQAGVGNAPQPDVAVPKDSQTLPPISAAKPPPHFGQAPPGRAKPDDYTFDIEPTDPRIAQHGGIVEHDPINNRPSIYMPADNVQAFVRDNGMAPASAKPGRVLSDDSSNDSTNNSKYMLPIALGALAAGGLGYGAYRYMNRKRKPTASTLKGASVMRKQAQPEPQPQRRPEVIDRAVDRATDRAVDRVVHPNQVPPPIPPRPPGPIRRALESNTLHDWNEDLKKLQTNIVKPILDATEPYRFGGTLGAVTGVPLGILAGLYSGVRREKPFLGMLRGGIRGASTGAGIGLGSVVGSQLGRLASGGNDTAGAVGAGIGALSGGLGNYYLSGKLLGKATSRREDAAEKARLDAEAHNGSAGNNKPVLDVKAAAVKTCASYYDGGYNGNGHKSASSQGMVNGYKSDRYNCNGHNGDGHNGDGHNGNGYKSDGHNCNGHKSDGHNCNGHKSDGHKSASSQNLDLASGGKVGRQSVGHGGQENFFSAISPYLSTPLLSKQSLTAPPRPLQLPPQPFGQLPFTQPTVQQGQSTNAPMQVQSGRGRPAGPSGTAQAQPAQIGVSGQPSVVAQLGGQSSTPSQKGFGNTPTQHNSGTQGGTSQGGSKLANCRKSSNDSRLMANVQHRTVSPLSYTPKETNMNPRQLDSSNPNQLNWKLAADMPQMAVQQYMPPSSRRDLDADEQQKVREGESRWLPRIFESYGTPAHEMMSSPGKGALLYGLGGAGLGALAGGALGNKLTGTHVGLGAALGAAAGGLGGGLLGYHSRKANNEGIKELMSHSPKGSTKRDLLSDPAYQQDINRLSYDRGGNMGQLGLMAALMSNR